MHSWQNGFARSRPCHARSGLSQAPQSRASGGSVPAVAPWRGGAAQERAARGARHRQPAQGRLGKAGGAAASGARGSAGLGPGSRGRRAGRQRAQFSPV